MVLPQMNDPVRYYGENTYFIIRHYEKTTHFWNLQIEMPLVKGPAVASITALWRVRGREWIRILETKLCGW